MKHTKEPWDVAYEPGKHIMIGSIHGFVAMIALTPVKSVEEKNVANARRIVAAVNACAGISDEVLAGALHHGVDPLQARISELEMQRDKLLAALTALYGLVKAEVEHFNATKPDDFIIEMVESAITGAK